ncbi:MAG: alpha/beta hydrolase [Phycisphaerales bacterium]|nr:alpha/beta hydrolase [Phycisphaerales bacterium]
MSYSSSQFVTSDGAEINLLIAGDGPPILLIPGWSQTAAMFKHQIEGLSTRYRVFAMDLRGHGDSSNIETGYSIDRLTLDTREIIESFDLHDLTLLGHSMGNQILWNYWRRYGADRLRGCVIAEQPASLIYSPSWSKEEILNAGALFTNEELKETCQNLKSDQAKEVTRAMLTNMIDSNISNDEFNWIVDENLKLPRHLASEYLWNCAPGDWRPVIRTIDLPTLIFSGRGSLVPWQSQEWTQKKIAGSQLNIFEPDDGGCHFMFLANPDRFNEAVLNFLDH